MKNIMPRLGLYLVWLLVAAVAFLLIALGRDMVIAIMSVLLGWNKYIVRFLDKIYYIVAGIGWMGFIFFAETYLAKGLERHQLGKRMSKIFGILLLSLVGVQVTLMLFHSIAWGWAGIALAGFELLLGGWLLYRSLDRRNISTLNNQGMN